MSSKSISHKHKKAKKTAERNDDFTLSDTPTPNIVLCNVGLMTGNSEEEVLELVGSCNASSRLPDKSTSGGPVVQLVMREHKSHSVLIMQDIETAVSLYTQVNAQFASCISAGGRRVYCAYATNVPIYENGDFDKPWPPGLQLLEDFITSGEETDLVDFYNSCTVNEESYLKQRRVKHFGYAWNYKLNTIDKASPLAEPIPAVCSTVLDRAIERGVIHAHPDQCTVNYYTPGEGIPPHVDTHSACTSTILSLSCSADIVMAFTHSQPHSKLSILLPRRSLLVMSGEARYDWVHSIAGRKTDVIPSGAGLTLLQRRPRLSFTFRSVIHNPCQCQYPLLCDSQNI